MTDYTQAWLPRGGEPDVLSLRAAEVPTVEKAQVLVRVEAAGMINADLGMRRLGWHPGSPRAPTVPGYEFAGVVEAVGPHVRHVQPGDRVTGILPAGAHAEYAVAEAWHCVEIPDALSFTDAVGLGVNYLTAYYLMHHAFKLPPDARVLIHGASGSVGTALSQLGKLAGLEMYGTASASNHDDLRGNNVTPIDYRSEDFERRVLEMTGDGVDVVYDAIGGSYWLRSYRTLRDGGRLLIFGGGGGDNFSPLKELGYALQILVRALTPDGKSVRFVGLIPERIKNVYREALAEMLGLLAEGKLDPGPSTSYPLSQIVQAHRDMEAGEVDGKVILLPQQ